MLDEFRAWLLIDLSTNGLQTIAPNILKSSSTGGYTSAVALLRYLPDERQSGQGTPTQGNRVVEVAGLLVGLRRNAQVRLQLFITLREELVGLLV